MDKQQDIGGIFAQNGELLAAKQDPSLPGRCVVHGSTVSIDGPAMTIDGLIVSAMSSVVVVHDVGTQEPHTTRFGVHENKYMTWNAAAIGKRKKNQGGRAYILVRAMLLFSVVSGSLILLLL